MITRPELLSPVDPEAPLLVVAARQETEHLDTELPILLTGIGRLSTTAALTEVLTRGPLPTTILNLGTAGSLQDDSGVHRVGTVVLHDFSNSAIARLTGSVPYPPIELGEGPVLATGDLFVEDSATRARLAQTADLVDMEGYAVAWVARRAGVPVELIKLVSDPADEDAGQLWLDGVAECSRILAAHLAARPAPEQGAPRLVEGPVSFP